MAKTIRARRTKLRRLRAQRHMTRFLQWLFLKRHSTNTRLHAHAPSPHPHSLHHHTTNAAVIYPPARLRLARNGARLRLGINCCGVCARRTRKTRRGLIRCRECSRALYCSPRCLQLDHPVHHASCLLLRTADTNAPPAATPATDHPKLVAQALQHSTLSWLLARPNLISHGWTAALIAAAPSCANLSLHDLSILSYPLSLALVASLLPTASHSSQKHRVWVVGAGPAECAVPRTCWLALADRITDLCFIGPEVNHNDTVSIGGVRIEYKRDCFRTLDTRATLVVGFNLGLTHPDYDWSDAPLLVGNHHLALFSNSRVELDAEIDLLTNKHGCKSAVSVVSRNPFHCPLWRQSTTLANDLYRKHSWLAFLGRRANQIHLKKFLRRASNGHAT